ncbi:MAG: FG-GAP-like repeat-containing protein [Trichodesmium sp.]
MGTYDIYTNKGNYYFGTGYFEIQIDGNTDTKTLTGNNYVNGSQHDEGTRHASNDPGTDIHYQKYTFYDQVVGNDSDNKISSVDSRQAYWSFHSGSNQTTSVTRSWNGSFNDYFEGLGGNDALYGAGGSDTLIGGTGHDLLYTGSLADGASDVLTGEDGSDTFFLGDSTLGQSDVVTGQGIDWENLGMSLAGDVSDLAFTIVPGLGTIGKITKEIVPMLFDVLKATSNNGAEVTGPTKGSTGSATITDFNPTEDVIFIPLPSDGNIYLQENSNGNNLLKVMHDTTGNDVIATVQLSNDVNTLEGYSSGDLQKDWFSNLESQALILDSNDAKDYKTNTSLNIPDADLEELGSKFLVLGAYNGFQLGGGNGANYMYGTQNNDVIAGYEKESTAYTAGDDVIYGFGGNDELAGGEGNDRIYGGDDIDTANYLHSTSGINANLGTVKSDSNGSYLEVSNDGFGTKDQLYSVENIVGSEHNDTVSFNDETTTNEATVEVKVYGLEGSQSPEGETNVLIEVENIIGSDNNNDTINFSALDGPVTISINTDGSTSATTDYTVTDFENIIGSSSGQDKLVPSGQVNLDSLTLENATIETGSIIGTINADNLTGSELNDFITGGGGVDTLSGGEGADIFYFKSYDTEVDIVTDFNPSEDIILVDSAVYSAINPVSILYTQEGDDVSVSVGSRSLATIENISVDEMYNNDTRYVTNSLPDWMTSQEIEVKSANSKSFGDLRPGLDTTGDLTGQVMATGIEELTVGRGGWSSFDKYPRAVGDVNNDGYEDIVGFGSQRVYTAISNGDGTFANKQVSMSGNFNYNSGWTSQNEYPRMLGDIDGDGNDDIIGFHSNQVYSSLSNGDGTFASPQVADDSGVFTPAKGWTSYNKNPRMVDDVNGDGFDDIIGFANSAIRVALSNGDGTFGNVYTAFNGDFTWNDGYTNQNVYPRMVGDINGDGMADIVGIDDNQVRLAFGQQDGTFEQPMSSQYNTYESSQAWMSKAQGWDNQEQYPRMLGDINGDGKDDLIGFNPDDDTVYVSYIARDGVKALGDDYILEPKDWFEAPVALTGMVGDTSITDFTGEGWTSQNSYPRMMGDITGNGQDDIIGFAHTDVFANVWQ